jgi:hypothetical protein
MKKNKMEKLSNPKFKQLSEDEFRTVNGGAGGLTGCKPTWDPSNPIGGDVKCDF